MVITEKLEVKWHYSNKKHYESILDEEGKQKYMFTKNRDSFVVDFRDIAENSSAIIQVICDYCGKLEERIHRNWRVHFDKSPVKKDACTKCRGKKTKESNMIIHGVSNVMHIEEVQRKVEETNIKRYGVKNSGGSKEAQEKIRQTSLKRYGTEHYFQTEQFKESYKNTMQEKYGVDNAFQAEEVKELSKKTMLENWGVEHNMQHPDIRKKAVNTMYERSSTPTSRPQLYLHQIYKGELNFPFERYNLDIALVKDKIAIEYDGGAHDLKVVLGGITQDDFNRREIIRGSYLKIGGWKLITIKSKKDSLPSESKLIEMLEDAKAIFSKNRSWVTYCIDSKTIEYKDNRSKYEFGELVKYKDVIKKLS